ncbi:TspO/MBR family protein [uncultured Flavobacterium sp.]|uniref:TspO/MBR family protein n=1 Tax=uncultured Flavobacterium sp. TaxID=165435 RepID=UPI0030CA5103
MKKYYRIIICVAVCLAVGYLSSLATQSSIKTWYPTLVKPFFNPPNWVFAPVWTLLYILMGLAAGMVWNAYDKNSELTKKGLLFFGIQLFFNALWSYLFFGIHNLLLASIEVILLLLLIYETYLIFKKIEHKASLLLIPYLVWVIFASALTISIWALNR